MVRDPDLIREILLAIEDYPENRGIIPVKIEGYDREQVSYHIGLLAEAGYVKAKNFRGDDQDDWVPMGMTWTGHEFLDAIRSDNVFNKIKDAFAKHGLSVVFTTALEVIKNLLV